jgi:hypothetical protein
MHNINRVDEVGTVSGKFAAEPENRTRSLPSRGSQQASAYDSEDVGSEDGLATPGKISPRGILYNTHFHPTMHSPSILGNLAAKTVSTPSAATVCPVFNSTLALNPTHHPPPVDFMSDNLFPGDPTMISKADEDFISFSVIV